MPNLVALTLEYASQKMRITLVTTLFSGYAVGGFMAALLGSWFTPTFGCKIMFFIAGIPLFLLPVIWKFLPESLAFIVKENKQEGAHNIVRRLAPNLTVTENTTFSLSKVEVPESANVVSLFRLGRARIYYYFGWHFLLAYSLCMLRAVGCQN